MFLPIKKIEELIKLAIDEDVGILEVEKRWFWWIRFWRIKINREYCESSKPKANIISENKKTGKQKKKKYVRLRSKHIGHINLAPSPSSPENNFIALKVGEAIKKGQTLAAIREFNIKSKVDGKILKICFAEGDKIKLGQTLFIIRPD